MGFACEPNSIPWPKFKPQKQAACMVNWLDIPRMTHEPDIAIVAIIVKIAISFFMMIDDGGEEDSMFTKMLHRSLKKLTLIF